jgi:small subunit ribosomal protein S20
VSGINANTVFETTSSQVWHPLSGYCCPWCNGWSIKHILEVYKLANIKSAKKRILVNETKAARNKAIKSKVKTMMKKVDAAVVAGDKDAAKANLVAAIAEIDKASSKGVYHKNTAARKVSRLAKAVNKIA